MQYLLMIHSDESRWNSLSDEENGAILARYGDRYGAMVAEKVVVDGKRLHDSSSATTVRVRNGELLTTAGPFSELKEQLGGFFLIDVPDLDAAIGWARRIPGAEYGSIEVRPVVVGEGDEKCS